MSKDKDNKWQQPGAGNQKPHQQPGAGQPQRPGEGQPGAKQPWQQPHKDDKDKHK